MAEGIYAGFVVGVNLIDFKNQKINEGLFPEVEEIQIPEEKEYKVIVLETLKGNKIENITMNWQSCGNGFPELRMKVILFKYKDYDYAIEFDQNIYEEITANKAI